MSCVPGQQGGCGGTGGVLQEDGCQGQVITPSICPILKKGRGKLVAGGLGGVDVCVWK